MIVGKVVGRVWSTVKEPNLFGFKLLLVQDVNHLDSKRTIVVVDLVDAGVGDRVLVVYEGGSARQCMDAPDAPVNAAAVGFVDSVTGYADA